MTYVACDKVVKLECLLLQIDFVDVLAVEMHGFEGVVGLQHSKSYIDNR